jgi:hypothetical protein
MTVVTRPSASVVVCALPLASLAAICGLFLVAMAGSGAARREIAAKLEADGPPRKVVVKKGTKGKKHVRVDVLEMRESQLLMRETTDAVIHSIEVVPGKSNAIKRIHPGASELRVGKRFLIVVEADGEVKTSMTDR